MFIDISHSALRIHRTKRLKRLKRRLRPWFFFRINRTINKINIDVVLIFIYRIISCFRTT